MLYKYKDWIIEITIKQVKHLRLIVTTAGKIRLTVPKGLNEELVIDFLKQHETWLNQSLAKSKKRYNPLNDITQIAFEEGKQINVLGHCYTFKMNYDKASHRPSITEDKDSLIFHSSQHDEKKFSALFGHWAMSRFTALIEELMQKWTMQMGINEKPIIRYKYMKSRWGRCIVQRKDICFSTSLIPYSPKAIEMIVVHELCHLFEPNHQKPFYDLMQHYLPDYKEREKLLK